MNAASDPSITVYGTGWCSDCRRSRAVLDGQDVAYRYIDIEAEPEAADYVRRTNGRTNVPYIVFGDGSTQTEPSDLELRERLVALELIPS